MSDGQTSEQNAEWDDATEVSVGGDEGDAAASSSSLAGDAHSAPTTDDDADDVASGSADGSEPQSDLEALTVKAEQYLALAQRTQADFENYRKRAARDAALAQERGISKLARELLPAIDNLERAVQAAEEAHDPLINGVKLVQAELLAALARVGIEPFSPAGEQFDPQHHEAVAQAPIEGAAAGTVVEVYQQGFRLGETVLRPARVLVAA